MDLHLHTYYSDGTSSPGQVMVDTAMLGMNLVAITDHDTTEGFVKAKQVADEWGLELMTGVEISTPKYHILGYNFDIENKPLQDLLAYSRNCQEAIVRQKIDGLKKMGVPITYEKVMLVTKSRIGTINMLAAMVRDPECRRYIGSRSAEEINRDYLKKVVPEYICPEVTPADAINAIHAAGGFAILAHPPKDVDEMSELEDLVRLGIDGLELAPRFGERNAPFKEFAQTHGLKVTYGSDYHGGRRMDRPLLSRNGNVIDYDALCLLR